MPHDTITFDDLASLLYEIFVVNGTSAQVAEVLAANCAGAERDAALSHGVFRMPGYVATLKSGWVDGHAIPVVEDVGAAFIRVAANNGFAQVALAAATPLALRKAREAGACVVSIRGSHHFGALWPDVEPFAEQGLVALAVVNSMALVVPHGANRPVYGTNPMAFAAPRAEVPPLVFDQAVSLMAHGDVQIAARDGHRLPEGAGVDRDGQPSRDPKAILDGGALLPFGGPKGSSLALMIEVLAAALSGGLFSYEVDWSNHPGARTPCTGECVILIDPARGGTLAGFTGRVERLIATLHDAGQERLPGSRRHAARARAAEHGIPLDLKTLHALQAMRSPRADA